MSSLSGRERPTAEGVVSGFVDRTTVELLEETIAQASISALASDLLAFWPPAKPPFVLALFESHDAFEAAIPRFAGMAATGATIVMGAPGKMQHLPAGLYGVDLRGSDDLVDARALVVLEGSFIGALVAVRSDLVVSGEFGEDEESLYNARWTFRRPRVVDAMEQLLRPLRPVLPGRVLEAADAAIARAADVSVSASESNLLYIVEQLSGGLVSAPVLLPIITEENRGPRIVRDEQA
jgi:hypothetical protein